MRGVDFEIDGLSIDALVAASDSCGFIFNFPFDIGKVVEPSVGYVMKLCPFRSAGSRRRTIRVICWVRRGVIIEDVDELQNQGPASDDAASSGQEISADNVF